MKMRSFHTLPIWEDRIPQGLSYWESLGKREGRKREKKSLIDSFVVQKFTIRSRVAKAFEISRDEAGSKKEGRGMTEGLQFNI